jgi:HupE / UreJ protein
MLATRRLDSSPARGFVRPLSFVACAGSLVLALAVPAPAHEIAAEVTVQGFLKPEGRHLHLLLRVPLVALRDVDYPTRGSEYLDLERAQPVLADAVRRWIADSLEFLEEEAPLRAPRIAALRVSLPSDRSFGTYEDAAAHLTSEALSAAEDLPWRQALLDVWFEYAIQSPASRFSIHPALERLGLRVVTVLRFLPPEGGVRAFQLVGDPGLVRLDPRWHQAALRFVALGFSHILDGTDHLLFLLCLVIPFRRWRPLVLIVTSFTVAHSVTLIASAFGLAPDAQWFPPLVEALIAASIVYMALENIVGPGLRRRWTLTFAFGLVHGFGFSFALRDTLQFAGSHLLTSLVSFNLGVELGQLAVLAVLVPALELLFRFVVAERVGTILLSAFVAHTGWHWMSERFSRWRQFSWEWPAVDAALLASVTLWLIAAVIVAGLFWIIFGVLLRALRRSAEGEAPPETDA